jgi:hypothetical protein
MAVRAILREFGGPIDPTGRRAQVADTNEISKEKAEEFARLVAAAKTQPIVTETGTGQGRDMMTYSITIEEDDQTSVLKQSDATRSQAFIDLQAWIKQNGHRQ